MAAADDVTTALDQISAIISQLTVTASPTISVNGESIDLTGYLAQLQTTMTSLLATRQALGLLGILLVGSLFAVLVWMLFFYDVVNSTSSSTLTWIILIGVAVILTVGMSWAHMRRRLSGQATVDEVGT